MQLCGSGAFSQGLCGFESVAIACTDHIADLQEVGFLDEAKTQGQRASRESVVKRNREMSGVGIHRFEKAGLSISRCFLEVVGNVVVVTVHSAGFPAGSPVHFIPILFE